MLSTDPAQAALQRLQAENDSLRRAVGELSTLNDISREIGALVDLDEVLRRIVDRSVAALQAQEGVITLVDAHEEHDLGHTLVRSMATSADREPFHLTDQIIGWMQLHRRPLRVRRGSDGVFTPYLAQERIEALLSVPLLARGSLLGVLTVYNSRRGDGFDDADQRLLAIIASQSAQIIENARLHDEEMRLREMQDDLRVAFEIQTRLLPAAPPTIDGYDLAARTIPAQEVGGDFFDYIPIDSRRTAICVGDVSGKGLPSALLMANAQATIRGQADPQRSPSETLERVNWQLYRSIRRGTFLTLFYAELDHDRHLLRCVNAGHNRPLIVRGNDVSELQGSGLAIGLSPRAEYEHIEIDLKTDDLLLIYSDGLTEGMNPAREQFGEERLVESLRRRAGVTASELVDGLLDDLRAHCGEAPRSDDVTIAAVIVR